MNLDDYGILTQALETSRELSRMVCHVPVHLVPCCPWSPPRVDATLTSPNPLLFLFGIGVSFPGIWTPHPRSTNSLNLRARGSHDNCPKVKVFDSCHLRSFRHTPVLSSFVSADMPQCSGDTAIEMDRGSKLAHSNEAFQTSNIIPCVGAVAS